MVAHKTVLCMGHLKRGKEAGLLLLEAYSIKELLWKFCKMNPSNRQM